MITAALLLSINMQAQSALAGCSANDTTAKCNSTISEINSDWQTGNKGKAPAKPAVHRNHKNICLMVDNAMFIIKDGLTMVMATGIMLKNGIVIMTDGLVIAQNGKKTKLKNGESINMQGMVYPTIKDKTTEEAIR